MVEATEFKRNACAVQQFKDLNGKPWLVKEAVEFLETILTKETKVLEIGSGSSTIWFAERVKSVISLDHDIFWYNLVTAELKAKGLTNVVTMWYDHKVSRKVVEALGPDDQFDVILVDGGEPGCRISLVWEVLPLLKPGGYFVFDNSNHRVYSDKLAGLSKPQFSRMDFRGLGYGTNPAHPWTTTVWFKKELAVWVREYEVDRNKNGNPYYVALVPNALGHEEELATFKDRKDALMFANAKAAGLGIPLVNFIKGEKKNERTT